MKQIDLQICSMNLKLHLVTEGDVVWVLNQPKMISTLSFETKAYIDWKIYEL